MPSKTWFFVSTHVKSRHDEADMFTKSLEVTGTHKIQKRRYGNDAFEEQTRRAAILCSAGRIISLAEGGVVLRIRESGTDEWASPHVLHGGTATARSSAGFVQPPVFFLLTNP